MVTLNTEVATQDGVLVATRVERHGVELFVIFLLGSTQGMIKELCSYMSEAHAVTKLNQLIRG